MLTPQQRSRRDDRPSGALGPDEDSYRQLLETFVSGSDEKTHLHTYLDGVIRSLRDRRTFLDVGPAVGSTTGRVGPFFERTVCIEPSATMRRYLQQSCPDATVITGPVLQAAPDTTADLALLAHVLYYLPRTEWTATVLRIMEWVRPGGVFLAVLQNPGNPCMRMLHYFTGHRFSLQELADDLVAAHSWPPGTVHLDPVPARYHSADLETATTAATFHLILPGVPLPARTDIADYVRHHFADPDGGFTMPHEQQVLRIQHPPG